MPTKDVEPNEQTMVDVKQSVAEGRGRNGRKQLQKGEMNRPEKEKEQIMKTIVILTAAVLLGGTIAWAQVPTKGGASKLINPPAAGSTKPAGAMSCALCKSEFVRVNVPSFKGSPTSVLAERHACKSCDTKVVTTGHGKAKVSRPSHACGSCAL